MQANKATNPESESRNTSANATPTMHPQTAEVPVARDCTLATVTKISVRVQCDCNRHACQPHTTELLCGAVCGGQHSPLTPHAADIPRICIRSWTCVYRHSFLHGMQLTEAGNFTKSRWPKMIQWNLELLNANRKSA